MSRKAKFLDPSKPENIRVERRPVWSFLMEIALKSWVDKDLSQEIFETKEIPHYFGWFADPKNPLSTISLADTGEEEIFKEFVLKKLSKDHFYFERVEKRFLEALERLNQFAFYIFGQTRKKVIFKEKEIINFLESFRPIYLRANNSFDFPYYFGEFVAELINKKANQKEKKQIFAQPRSLLELQEKELLKEIKKIKQKRLKNPILIEKLESYLKLFGFLKGELKVDSSPKEVLLSLKKPLFSKRKERKLKTIKISSKFFPWVFWMRKLFDYRNIEAQYFARADFLMKKLYQEAGKLTGIKAYSLIAFIGFDELISALKTKTKLNTLVKERKRRGVTIAFREGAPKIYTGLKPADKKLLEKVLKYQDKESKEEKLKRILKGMIAYKGKRVTGKALVIFSPKEAKDLKKDFILVAPNTDPSFVPIMKKAKGIITDEGGILSHAAIMAREFEIPCIVGTKLATKTIKSGQEISLNSEKGEVIL